MEGFKVRTALPFWMNLLIKLPLAALFFVAASMPRTSTMEILLPIVPVTADPILVWAFSHVFHSTVTVCGSCLSVRAEHHAAADREIYFYDIRSIEIERGYRVRFLVRYANENRADKTFRFTMNPKTAEEFTDEVRRYGSSIRITEDGKELPDTKA